ncbi:MAG TPA: adenylate/guanylate cyclase domain-containing protein [Candidatus Kryptonia bacterium]|nr:adenylate/guanylate cyclase domain-containing protein [Candidatus Kryptonia bacterium]
MACGHDNRDTAKFCLTCGQRLAHVCGSCGAELPGGARFCDECGTPVGLEIAPGPRAPSDASPSPQAYTPQHLAAKILMSRSALEGERKPVTVLFADCMGSTAMAERLDPEEVHGIMDRCFRILAEEVHRYEGTINQFTGDGIMALFGAPIAHEDAPERAVRAALAMQSALQAYHDELERERGIDFRMRIGINTGPVVVGKIGDDLRMDYTAIGDTTNLAARLQTAAAPGSVLISPNTAKLVGSRFVTRPVGPLQLKGKARPVEAFEVVRAAPRAPLVAPSEHGLTPLVGRVHELAILETIFRRVASEHGQVVFVVGEAGIGKSRLLYEFRQRLHAEATTWIEGRCISFGRGIPFLPIIDAVKSAFGIDEADAEAGIIDKIAHGLSALGPEMPAAAPYLRALLAVDPGAPEVAAMDAGARRFATFDALKRLMLALARRQPLVVLIEDLHWLDPASEEFLTYIIDAVAAARILILCTHRPGYQTPLGDRSYFQRLSLQPLPPDEAAAIAAAMLATRALPDDARTLITKKAEGNPFFVEEVTKSLVELGVLRRDGERYALDQAPDEIAIPNRIQDVIMARIDRLGDEPKRAMQVASVIGREFAVRLLQRATEVGDRVTALVGELRALELIYEKSGVPELAYMFKHALTHDVAYESLLLQRRKQLHLTIGRAIEDLYAERLTEYWETLAHHYLRAEAWDKAFDYLVKAGDKARLAFANHEAAQFYNRALEVAPHLQISTAQRAAIMRDKAWAHMCISEFSQAVDAYREAMQLSPDGLERAEIATYLGVALWYAHEFDAAIEVADEAFRLAEVGNDAGLKGGARAIVGVVQLVRGQLDGCMESMTEAARYMRGGAKHPLLGPWVDSSLALHANWQGNYPTALQCIEPLLDELRGSNQLFTLVQVSSHCGITLGGAGYYGRALSFLDESIALTESIGDRFWRARMWNTRGWVLQELGAFEAADESNRRCLEISRQLGSLRMTPELIGNAACNLADAALARGDLVGAEPYLAEVAAILADSRNEWMTWRYRMHYELSAAELAIARGELAQARKLIESCLVAAQRTNSRKYIAKATRLLAACHLAAGDLAASEQLMGTALEIARAMGNPPQLWHSLVVRGRVLHALGRRDEAARLWGEAQSSIASVSQHLPPDLQSTLRHSPVGATVDELVN